MQQLPSVDSQGRSRQLDAVTGFLLTFFDTFVRFLYLHLGAIRVQFFFYGTIKYDGVRFLVEMDSTTSPFNAISLTASRVLSFYCNS